MTLEVNLRRIGSSRSSMTAIPIVARVLQGGRFGEDILAGRGIRDMRCAQDTIYEILRGKLGPGVILKFTGEET